MKQLPLYQCHKQVRAAKITGVAHFADGASQLFLQDVVGAVEVDVNWLTRNPKLAVGGYFVQYELAPGETEPYTAYSPAEPFESGYTLATQ